MKYSVPSTPQNLEIAKAIVQTFSGVEVWPDMQTEITFISDSGVTMDVIQAAFKAAQEGVTT